MAYTTALRGLSAQGNTEFTGMCYSNNDVSFTMTSTEFANAGFKYIVKITDGITNDEYKFYISPNSVGSGVFNTKTIFNQLIKTEVTIDGGDDVLLQITEPTLVNNNLVNRFTVDLYEGYEVGGVFTEDESVAVEYSLMCVYGKGKSNFLVMGSNETPPIALSQYYDNTIGFGNETVATRINIPLSLQSEIINWQRVSRSNVLSAKDSAYKILSFIADDGTYINDNYPYRTITHIKYNLFDGEFNSVAAFLIPITFDDGAILHIPAGLKNLIDGAYIDQNEADDTIFWTISGYDEEAGDVTAKYGFYIDEDCKHNPVHVYWLNQLGGWDSYSFIKKNERSIDVEKKRYKTYLGNYNTADVDNPFDTKNYSRALTEREPIVKTFINLTSDWLTESEYKAMKDLFYSKSVWMVDDNVDGYSILPVVVEDTNYLMKRERNFRKYNQTLRLQLANEYDTINTTVTTYPIPAPEPCSYFNIFAKTGGNTHLNLGPVVDNACVIVVTNATMGRQITISVRDSSNNTPIPGQTYYVEINYDFTVPSPTVMGFLALGNTSTGGGTLIQSNFNTPGTPIIVNAVWGTYTTSFNYMYLQMPRFFGTVSGEITIKVGFGNCP